MVASSRRASSHAKFRTKIGISQITVACDAPATHISGQRDAPDDVAVRHLKRLSWLHGLDVLVNRLVVSANHLPQAVRIPLHNLKTERIHMGSKRQSGSQTWLSGPCHVEKGIASRDSFYHMNRGKGNRFSTACQVVRGPEYWTGLTSSTASIFSLSV
jgi:hypothetical protein